MNFLKTLGVLIIAAFKALTGKKGDDVIVHLPDNVAITTEQLDKCIAIVNQVKSVVNSPLSIVVTNLIPGSIDDIIRAKLSDLLPDLLASLTFIKGYVNGDQQPITIAALERVQMSPDAAKNAFYHSLAAQLIVTLSDGKVTWSEAVSILEVYFKNFTAKQ